MYRYKYDKSYHHKSRKARHGVFLASVVTIIAIGAAGFIGYDVLHQTYNKQAPQSRTNYSSVQGDSVNQFSSPYFQFQTNDKWKEATNEEREGHYVYRSYKGTLVEHDLVIDINNKTPVAVPNVRTTNVYPVTIDPSGRLIAQGGAGDHCKTLMPKNSPNVPTLVKERQVSFVCTPDAILYQVVVGLVGGTTDIPIPRPSGGSAVYTIVYRDLTISPTEADLRGIIESFQTR